MSRWFSTPLETVATFCRLLRRDGVTLGFTAHDRDLWIDGVLHAANPGMVASSIRRSAGFDADSAEVTGALSHDSIAADDLAEGRYDGAHVRIGVVDWESGESELLYSGTIGALTQQDDQFTAELSSRKADLAIDPIPRTSPACRAEFCGPGCGLASARFTHEATVAAVDPGANAVSWSLDATPSDCVGGRVRWLDGPHAGLTMRVTTSAAGDLVLDSPLSATLQAGARALIREGCDHTLDTCATRFANALNFQGEPFLPGNDLLVRYPAPAS
jgi:uncharacterized phage protein (TIGR02218 family)